MINLLRKLKLEHIRGFKNLELDFTDEQGALRKTTLIIGKNGTNKTTLLRTIALAFQDAASIAALLKTNNCHMIRKGTDNACISLELQDPSMPSTLEFQVVLKNKERSEYSPFQNTPPTGFVAAFGAGRYAQGSRQSESSVASLFDESSALIDSELALYRLQNYFAESYGYEHLMQRIKAATGLTNEDSITIAKGGGIVIQGPSTDHNTIPIQDWADGYRRTLAWILDLFTHAIAHNAIDADGNIKGILLIDELEQHLHPSMQVGILDRLNELFPRMQLIVTTHSPMIALGLFGKELITLKKEADEIIPSTNVHDLTDYSAEDLLDDPELFDSNVYGPEIAKKVDRYEELSAIDPSDRSDSENRQLRDLANELESLGIIGSPQDYKSEIQKLADKLGV